MNASLKEKTVAMNQPTTTGNAPPGTIANVWSGMSSENRPIAVSSLFILAILTIGTVYTLEAQGTTPLLSPTYLLQQLQVGAFLGIVAAGMMLVILLGQIDLSVPWTVTTAAMMATMVGGPWAIPVGLAVGLGIGLFNGFGVATLRLPSMIFTLGVNATLRGLMVVQTGGYAPQTTATAPMRFLGAERWFDVPMALIVWAAVSLVIAVMLRRTTVGRSIYTIGNGETAAYLAGIPTRRVIITAFAACGLLSGLAGLLLAGYAGRAYQGMGDNYALPAIAAVVIGGTRIVGGRGRYLGTLLGVAVIVLLNSVLSIMQMQESIRMIIYGSVIISMLMLYRQS